MSSLREAIEALRDEIADWADDWMEGNYTPSDIASSIRTFTPSRRLLALIEPKGDAALTDERAAFEKHIRGQFPTVRDEMLVSRSRSGNYGSMVTEHAWRAWQARAVLAGAAPSSPPADMREATWDEATVGLWQAMNDAEKNGPHRTDDKMIYRALLARGFRLYRAESFNLLAAPSSPPAHPEANIHGIGPDVGAGPNPHFVPDDEPGQLDPEMARRTARQAMAYSAAFDGKGISWHSDEPWPHRMELAQALDWITDLGAMVLNLADRVAAPSSPPAEPTLWLMRDDHMFLRLPLHVDDAMKAIQNDQWKYGMLTRGDFDRSAAPLHLRDTWPEQDVLRWLIDSVAAALAARSSSVEPAGWKLVPLEPPNSMEQFICNCDVRSGAKYDGDGEMRAPGWRECYRKLLAASPPAARSPEPDPDERRPPDPAPRR